MRAIRRVLLPVGIMALTVGIAAVLIVTGRGLFDLPSGIHDVGHWYSEDPTGALVTVVIGAAWCVLLWLCLGFAVGSLQVLPGLVGRLAGRLARWMLPRAMHRLLEVSLGLSIVASSAGGLIAATPASASTLADTPRPAAAATQQAWPDLSPHVSPAAASSAAPRSWPDLAPLVAQSPASQSPASQSPASSEAPRSWPSLSPPLRDPTASTSGPGATAPSSQATAPPTANRAPNAPTRAPSTPSTPSAQPSTTQPAAPAATTAAPTAAPTATTPAGSETSSVPSSGTPDSGLPSTGAQPPGGAQRPGTQSPAGQGPVSPTAPVSPSPDGAGPRAGLPAGTPIVALIPRDQSVSASATPQTGAPDPGAPSLSPSASAGSTSPTPWTPTMPTNAPAGGVRPASMPATGWPDLSPPLRPPSGSASPSSSPSGSSTPDVGALGGSAPRGIGEPSGDGSHTEVVVLRGDSLWTIAARHLGPNATEAEIAAEWPRWWAANRDVIGADPNVIFPGQRLQPPSGP